MHNPFYRLWLMAMGFLFPCFSIAQQFPLSPYTSKGIGEFQRMATTEQMGFGGGGYAFQHELSANLLNPAAYSALVATSIQARAEIGMQKQNTATEEQTLYPAGFRMLSLGMRFSKRWAGGLGIMPFSAMAYQSSKLGVASQAGQCDYYFSGFGQINRAFGALSFRLFPQADVPQHGIQRFLQSLSFGYAGGFLFGQQVKRQETVFTGFDTSGVYNRFYQLGVNYGGWNHQIGVQGLVPLDREYGISFGISYSPGTNFKTSNDFYSLTYSGSTRFNILQLKDTSLLLLGASGRYSIPGTLGLGLGLVKGDTLGLFLDFSQQLWTNSTEGISQNVYTNRYGIGLQVRPSRDNRADFFKRTAYRVGFQYTQRPMPYFPDVRDSWSATVGFGFSFRKFSIPSLQLAFEAGERSNLVGLREQFYMLHLGITYSERWFQRSRID